MYWSAGVETARPEQILRGQGESLRDLMKVCARVPYYRAAFDAVGVSPHEILELADLAAVPFFGKDQLRELQPLPGTTPFISVAAPLASVPKVPLVRLIDAIPPPKAVPLAPLAR
jgi:phenylacetate-coenzyme A ligase PaaK-like adenylate-forming protein